MQERLAELLEEFQSHDAALARIAELECALRDCIPFLAVHMDKYRRDYDLSELHATHAEILDRVSRLSGGGPLACKLARR